MNRHVDDNEMDDFFRNWRPTMLVFGFGVTPQETKDP